MTNRCLEILIKMATGKNNTTERPLLHSLLIECLIDGVRTNGDSEADVYFWVAETFLFAIHDIHIEHSRHRGPFRNKFQKFAEILVVNLDMNATLHLIPILLRFICESLKSLMLNFQNGALSVEKLYRVFFQGVICVYVSSLLVPLFSFPLTQSQEGSCLMHVQPNITISCFLGEDRSSCLV